MDHAFFQLLPVFILVQPLVSEFNLGLCPTPLGRHAVGLLPLELGSPLQHETNLPSIVLLLFMLLLGGVQVLGQFPLMGSNPELFMPQLLDGFLFLLPLPQYFLPQFLFSPF